jgi:hypothetical protein
MVILKNITKTANEISADYFPEGKEPMGFMKLRLSDNKVIEHIGNKYSMAPMHVRYELQRLAKVDNPPTEKNVIWY